MTNLEDYTYMKLLLLYATNSGGTEMAAQMIAQYLSGHTVDLKRVIEASPEDITGYDAVVFGSPSWDFNGEEGQPHDDFWEFKKKMEGKSIEGKKTAIFGLGDNSYKVFNGAVTVLEQWVADWKGVLLLPSLRMDKFYYRQAENTQLIEEWCKKLNEVLK